MPAQMTYTMAAAVALEGMLADIGYNDIISRSASGVVDYGVAVSRNAVNPDKSCSAGGTAFIGISVRSVDHEQPGGSSNANYPDKTTVPILTKGYIWCKCTLTGAVPGQAVRYVNFLGSMAAGAAVASQTNLVGSTWQTTTPLNGLGIVKLEGSQTTAGA